ncbi:NUDIX hydrolase [Clostridium folliculivorans]|uniref:NUDIX hydrolase n=1 Tax=Clostridium folliculivorans TaxID=2886038 RepID=A0A9W5Y0T5_9CLOT|nr:NUDIX hydrolase [Clostridium folliculivorans]GKU24432.1 NUDIX hydrolase [Clostridium folliculivorans]GKU30526.1 NUDIX hydrolase [Clostridium folliculivorans]
MAREIWDAYDKEGNKLGFDQFRDEPIAEGVYHIVVEIYAVTENNEVLITQRHKNKPWALKWEVTSGSILKGETPEQGAIRELKEETGIEVRDSDLNFVYSYIYKNVPSIYKCFVVFINKEKTKIQLQEEETIDYRYLPYNEFKQFIKTDEYVDWVRERFCVHEKIFDTIIHQR